MHSNCSTHTVPNQYYRRWVWVIQRPYNISNIPTQEQVNTGSNLNFSINSLIVRACNSDYASNSRLSNYGWNMRYLCLRWEGESLENKIFYFTLPKWYVKAKL
jgi:hypothetical protein